MMTLFKILTMIWPFVREMFFGNKSFSEILRENKFRVAVLVFITVSVTLNYFLTSRMVAISREYLALKADYEALKSSKKTPVTQSQEVKQKIEETPPARKPVTTGAVIPHPSSVSSHHAGKASSKRQDDSAARYKRLQETLVAIKTREDNEE